MAIYSKSYDKISDYYLEISRGNVVDTSSIHKFGYAEDVDTGDGESTVWDGSANDIGGKIKDYNYITTPTSLSIASTEGDTVEMVVQGNDEEGLEATETVELTGTVATSIPGTWTAINRVYNNGSVDLSGTVFLFDTGSTLSGGRPTDDLVVRAIVHNHANQTQQAVYTVPSDRALYITQGWSHISKASNTEAVLTIYKRVALDKVFRIVHTLALQTTGSSGDTRPYSPAIRFEGGSVIVYKAQALSNSTAISAGFHGVLIKE